MKTLNETRKKAYKSEPELAAMTDFYMAHERKIKSLHRKYKTDSENNISLLDFFNFIYHHAQDLIINPTLN